MLSRSEIIDRLKSFKDIDTYTNIEAFNTDVELYVVRSHTWHKTILIIDRAQDNKVIYLDNRELTLIKLANRDVFFNPNSFFLESARITLYLKGSLAFSTSLSNLTKQEVSQ